MLYTKKGDRGETGLPGGRRLPKTEAVFEFLGSLDATNATIGLAVSQLSDRVMIKLLEQVQADLLTVGATVAAESPSRNFTGQLEKQTALLERQIDEWDRGLPKLENFILPGGVSAGAALHLARTIIRQSERDFHRLRAVKIKEIAVYLNRLSDFLFQAARWVNYQAGQKETIWKNS